MKIFNGSLWHGLFYHIYFSEISSDKSVFLCCLYSDFSKQKMLPNLFFMFVKKDVYFFIFSRGKKVSSTVLNKLLGVAYLSI
jgi:hypothetical protein